ncbi:diguanylate cyclase [Klebsiella pneumoniae]|uniref:Diguanylate cyclase n=1 Tax=Klebsiella pneumoniae TaxID=573 RepID=A0A377V3S5_KLEPN|nr:diguanylate cyclase [Klebsiella pneumoniae]
MGCRRRSKQPLDIDVLRKASQRYLSQRHQQAWRVALPNRRTLPVFGISGSVAGDNPILLVDDPLAADELMATLELGLSAKSDAARSRFRRADAVYLS